MKTLNIMRIPNIKYLIENKNYFIQVGKEVMIANVFRCDKCKGLCYNNAMTVKNPDKVSKDLASVLGQVSECWGLS